jgi:hypothetical protein
MNLRLFAGSAVMVAAAAFAAVSPAAAQASTASYATTQASHSSVTVSPDSEYIVHAGSYSTNKACALAGAKYLEGGAYEINCVHNTKTKKWDLYVTYVIK